MGNIILQVFILFFIHNFLNDIFKTHSGGRDLSDVPARAFTGFMALANAINNAKMYLKEDWDRNKIDPKKVEIFTNEKLGKGSFGNVFKANYAGEAVAAKIINTADIDNDENTKIFRESKQQLAKHVLE